MTGKRQTQSKQMVSHGQQDRIELEEHQGKANYSHQQAVTAYRNTHAYPFPPTPHEQGPRGAYARGQNQRSYSNPDPAGASRERQYQEGKKIGRNTPRG
ncbi:hypothetical protein CSW37_09790 [Thermus scotoductus]|uniref:Uncharacterized protein n=1 Tax=Thermus scotoductus TaxID=37636 RepID=A0A430SBT2_THESC|nr:hypothetical protein CSW37_09790 [Thermus scotoductus]